MLPAKLLPMLSPIRSRPYPFTTVEALFAGPFEELADFQLLVQRFNFLRTED